PHVPAGGPADVVPGAAHDEDVLEMGQVAGGLVGGGLHLDRLPAAELPVARDQQLRARVLEPEAQRLGAEPAADERVHGAGPRGNGRSVVAGSLAPGPWSRKRPASALNPPKTSECTAPIRAQARAMTTVSTSTGR